MMAQEGYGGFFRDTGSFSEKEILRGLHGGLADTHKRAGSARAGSSSLLWAGEGGPAQVRVLFPSHAGDHCCGRLSDFSQVVCQISTPRGFLV